MKSSLSLLALCGLLSACVPQVGHGPRVEPGFHRVMNSAVVHAPGVQGEKYMVVPSLWGGLAYGLVPSSERWAASLSAQVPAYLVPLAIDDGWNSVLRMSFVDAYAQLVRGPADLGVDVGVGAMGSASFAVPYVQAGLSVGGDAIYTTQALAVTYGEFDRAWYWMPTLTWHNERARSALDTYVTATLGRLNGARELFVSLGLILESRRQRQ
jgi:hypothetical protein